MADFICLNMFVTELTSALDASDTRLPIPPEKAAEVCDGLGVDGCAGCLPGDEPPTSVDTYTRLVLHHNGRFEIVKVVGCDQGVPIIERGEEGTTPLSFPIGTCVQFVWTCANIEDMVNGALDQSGLSFDALTNILSIIPGGGTPTVDLSALDQDTYVVSAAYDKPSNELTLTLNDASTVVVEISPYPVTMGYDVGTEVLTITLSDGSTVSTTIPQVAIPPDKYLSGVSFDNISQIATFSMSDGASYDLNLSSLYGLYLQSAAFSSITNILTLTMSDASTIPVDLTALSERVTGVSFSDITNVLTLVKNIGGNLTADLSSLAENTTNATLGINPVDSELTLTDSDGASLVADLEYLDNPLVALTYNPGSNLLTGALKGGSLIPVTINNPAINGTFTTTDGKTVTVTNGWVTSIV